MRKLSVAALFALPLVSACGPTEMEAGQAVLVVAPLITLAGGLVAQLYAWAWKPLLADLEFRYRQTLLVAGLQIVAALGIALIPQLDEEWVQTAMLAVGTSYLSLHLLSLRLALVQSFRPHYSAFGVLPWLALYLPALWLGYLGSLELPLGEPAALLWILPGYAGLVTGPLALLLACEVGVRRYRLAKKRTAEKLPRPMPEARARFRKP